MKKIVKIVIDIIMLILMILEYSRIALGPLIHEIIGITLFILFIIHNLLNISFYKSLFKGKYTPVKIINLVINSLFLVSMVLTITFGFLVSTAIFNFNGNMQFRVLHSQLAYISLILLSLHLGINLKIVFGKAIMKLKKHKKIKIIIYLLELLLIIFGIKYIIDTNIIQHLIGNVSFGNYEENLILEVIKKLVIVFSIAVVMYNIEKIVIKVGEKNVKRKSSSKN